MMTNETGIKKQIKDYLRLKGYFVFHILQGLGSYRGTPDLICIKDGIVLLIEVKTPTGKLSEYQKQFKSDWEARKGNYVVARNYEDVELCFNKIMSNSIFS